MSKKVNFTKTILTTVRPTKRGERLTLLDSKVHGLQCRITHSGIVTFSIYRRIKSGRIERVTIGRFPDISIEQARDHAVKISACIADGGDPVAVKNAFREEPVFKELFWEYIEHWAKPNKRTWKTSDVSNFKLYLEKPFGNKKVSQITTDDVASLHAKISRQPNNSKQEDGVVKYKTITANRVLCTISAVFKWGTRQRLCKYNPATGIKQNPKNARERFLHSEELPLFLKELDAEPEEAMRDYIWLAIYTGARRGNLLAMQWKQISIHQKLWIIPNTKNGEPHVIPLIDEAMSILKRRMNNGSEFVFQSKYGGHIKEPRYALKRILERSGIAKMTIHDLRRTLASWQAITGSSLPVIGKTLGHKSPQATAVYARLSIDPVRNSIQTATDAMLVAAGRKVRNRIAITSLFNKKAEKRTVYIFPWVGKPTPENSKIIKPKETPQSTGKQKESRDETKIPPLL